MLSNIKYIHCFGTSHTAGGGFEFNCKDSIKDSLIRKYYSLEDEDLTQFNFSYPGQLQKLVGDNIKVYNYGKQGYGNDRLYRKFYDIVNNEDFKNSENIFIFEFTGLGRKEYFLNQINKHITINWQHQYNKSNIKKTNFTDVASSYYYEDETDLLFLKKESKFFKKYVDFFVNWEIEFKKLSMEIEFFIAYLDKFNINYFFTSPPPLIQTLDSHKIEFGDGTHFKKRTNFLDFTWDNKLTIKDETDGGYNELHNGFKSNKLCAIIIFNKLIQENYINFPFISIDWKDYKIKNMTNISLI